MRQRQRFDLVENALRTEEWTEDVVQRLVAETGACRATIYRDRSAVLVKLAEEEQAHMPERRAGFLLELRQLRRKALKDGKYSPAVRTMAMEAQVLGLVAMAGGEQSEAPASGSLEAVLSETQRLRRRAEASDSWVAVERLLAREGELAQAIAERDRKERDAQMGHMDVDAMFDRLVANVAAMPDAYKDRLRAALG